VNPELLASSIKLHLLYHKADDIKLFGALRHYATEMQEGQNKDIRRNIHKTTKINPSHDVHFQFDSEKVTCLLENGLNTLVNDDISGIHTYGQMNNNLEENREVNERRFIKKYTSIFGMEANSKKNFKSSILRRLTYYTFIEPSINRLLAEHDFDNFENLDIILYSVVSPEFNNPITIQSGIS
jgi:hypothetical protein